MILGRDFVFPFDAARSDLDGRVGGHEWSGFRTAKTASDHDGVNTRARRDR